MTDAIQSAPVAPVTPTPTVKRISATPAATKVAVPAVTPAAATKAAPPITDNSPPIDPVEAIEPKTRITVTHDDDANTFVYERVDKESGKVIWQYPIEQVLHLARRLREVEGIKEHQVDRKV